MGRLRSSSWSLTWEFLGSPNHFFPVYHPAFEKSPYLYKGSIWHSRHSWSEKNLGLVLQRGAKVSKHHFMQLLQGHQLGDYLNFCTKLFLNVLSVMCMHTNFAMKLFISGGNSTSSSRELGERAQTHYKSLAAVLPSPNFPSPVDDFLLPFKAIRN